MVRAQDGKTAALAAGSARCRPGSASLPEPGGFIVRAFRWRGLSRELNTSALPQPEKPIEAPVSRPPSSSPQSGWGSDPRPRPRRPRPFPRRRRRSRCATRSGCANRRSATLAPMGARAGRSWPTAWSGPSSGISRPLFGHDAPRTDGREAFRRRAKRACGGWRSHRLIVGRSGIALCCLVKLTVDAFSDDLMRQD